jgi:hypothetical protein
MPAMVAPMFAARAVLDRDLRAWQNFAGRDGWPSRDAQVSFAEMADRLKSSAHLRGWTGTETKIAAVVIDTGRFRAWNTDHCDYWQARPPNSSVYMMIGRGIGGGDPAPTETVPRAAPPKVAAAMRDFDPPYGWDGPFASAKTAGVWLMLPLYQEGNEAAVAFFSGADVTQYP